MRKSNLTRLDTELLLASALGKDRVSILAHPEHALSPQEFTSFKNFAVRRKKHEPLAYILGEKEFFGRNFFVNRHTLIPRPETELLVEKSIEVIQKVLSQRKKKKVAIIDVGTGSGCIIASIALSFRKTSFSFFATDISKRALQVAEKNMDRYGLREISLAPGNLLTPIKRKLASFDEIFILANLPYLSEKLYEKTAPNVREFEPKRALLASEQGLALYRELFDQIHAFLPGEKVNFFLEISPEQASPLPDFLPRKSRVNKDLSGRPRVITGELS